MSIPRANNFDLIRLLAASQVVLGHICTEVGPSAADKIRPVLSWIWWEQYLPGVPIFFTVSGFLIYWSFERNADRIADFYKNRVLRIYPGLWVCFAITIALLIGFRQISVTTLGRIDFWAWVARQLTFFQFGTPAYFKHWGDGQVNRSLWTISVELQFYAVIPLIYYVFKCLGKRWYVGWAALYFGSIAVYAVQSYLPKGNIFHDVKDLGLASCLYVFLYGIAIYKCWNRARVLFEGRFIYWLAAYFAFICFMRTRDVTWHYPYSPEPIRMVGYFILSGLTLSLAFSYRAASERLIRGFDISYGVYIYHGLVLNCFIVFGWMNRWELALLILPIAWLLGAASWVFVERPMLRRKHKALREIPAPALSIEEETVAPATGAA